jgi:hypothetical protein
MAKTTKFLARYNGEIVGTRTSQSMAYTHAIVVIIDAAAVNAAAASWTKADQKDAVWSFNHKTNTANGGNLYTYETDAERAERVAKAKAEIEGGLDAFIERAKAYKLETRRYKGEPKPLVRSWSQSARNAEKASRSLYQYDRLLAVVEAERA